MKIADLFATLGLRANKKQFSAADRLLGGIKSALVGIVAFKTVRFFGNLIRDTAQAADNFAKMSKKVGISIEALQQFEFAAQISGTNVETFRKGIQRLARNASDSQRGLKTAQDALGDVGIKITKNTKELPALDDMLLQIADTFASMPDGTKKAALAQEIFGRAGAELIPLLNEGREGIGKLREEFVGLGAQIDGQTAKQFEEFNDDQLRVQTAMKGIRNEVVIALLPMLKTLTKQILAWVKANRQLIRQKLQSIMKGLVSALKFLVKAVVFVIENWKLLLGLLIGVKVIAGLAALAAMFGTLGAAGTASGFAVAAAWTAALLPFLIIGAIVGTAIAFILDFFGVFGDTNPISRFREILIDAFVGWLEGAGEDFGQFFLLIVEKAKIAARAIKDAFDFVTKTATESLEELAEEAEESRQGFITALQATANNTRPQAERPAATAPGGNTTNSNQLNATINVTAGEGADGEGIAKSVQTAIGNFWNAEMRKATAAGSQ